MFLFVFTLIKLLLIKGVSNSSYMCYEFQAVENKRNFYDEFYILFHFLHGI